MKKLAIFNGPNLASLGLREPMVYGSISADQLEVDLLKTGIDSGYSVRFNQFDQEGLLISAIQEVSKDSVGLIINPGGFSHTSVAVLDAMRAFDGPVIEVHISQIHKREPYRHRMLTAQGADVVISGAGIHGYLMAINTVTELLRR